MGVPPPGPKYNERRVDGFTFKKYNLSTSVKPCFLQSKVGFPSALESSAYLKHT